MAYEEANQKTAQGVAYVSGDNAAEVLEQIDPEHWNHDELSFKEKVTDVHTFYGESVYKVTIVVELA